MGVSGVGKSTVAERLAAELDLELAEGDAFHPEANIAKMSAGDPLTDEDRWPWLAALAGWTAERREAGRDTVLTCSALKRVYRDVLRRGAPDSFFVCLAGDEALLRERMEGREHFMPPSLLRSQLDTLEPLEGDEPGTVVDVARSIDEIVAEVVALVLRRTL
ncbi:gluconokinase [Nocardioides sp. HDW12B]|nr:gluconokinase [Nocardioides sp. HDW12B]